MLRGRGKYPFGLLIAAQGEKGAALKMRISTEVMGVETGCNLDLHQGFIGVVVPLGCVVDEAYQADNIMG
ncbi:MAG: hypothetical protein VCF08_12945, partial [Alphaproteobacteria bacterium]